jgi:mannitol/fructose-specific phosphotransferase system IIA component
MSYWYYDPIIAIISENVSNTKREILSLKQRLAHKLHFEGDVKRSILLKTGIYTSKNKEPLTFKYTALNKKPPTGINHHNSEHAMSLQRSNYICLDDNTDKKFVMENQNKKELKKKQNELN